MRHTQFAIALAALFCLTSANDAHALFGRKKAPAELVVTADTGSEAIQKALQSGGKKLSVATGQDVVIGAFSVSFINHHHQAVSSGFGGRARMDLELNLLDLSNETMQAIADQAYDAFVADLNGKGYRVKSLSDTQAMSGFNDSQAVGDASGILITTGGLKATAFAPKGYRVLTGAHMLQSGLAAGDQITGTLQVFNAIGQGTEAIKGAKALKPFVDANPMPMLDVSLVLDFADMEAKTLSVGDSKSAGFATNLGVHVNTLNTYVSLTSAGKTERVSFKSGVRSEGGAIAKVENISKLKSNLAVGAINLLAGKGSSSKFVKKAVHADEQGFQAQSVLLVDKIGEALIDSLMK